MREQPRATSLSRPRPRRQNLKKQIEEQGADFASLAKKHSQCPSGRSGGSLGEFGRGDMVPEFDRVVFGDLPVGAVSAR